MIMDGELIAVEIIESDFITFTIDNPNRHDYEIAHVCKIQRPISKVLDFMISLYPKRNIFFKYLVSDSPTIVALRTAIYVHISKYNHMSCRDVQDGVLFFPNEIKIEKDIYSEKYLKYLNTP